MPYEGKIWTRPVAGKVYKTGQTAKLFFQITSTFILIDTPWFKLVSERVQT